MDELTAFLNARLDEDEAAAKAWQTPPWREDATSWKVVGQREPCYDNGRSETLTAIDVSGRVLDFAEAIQVRWDSNGERAVHIARHDPARVLREVAAKRAIVNAHETAATADRVPHPGATAYMDGYTSATEVVLRALATAWSGHPDYRAEWAP